MKRLDYNIEEKKLIFQISETDNLQDIIFKGRNTIVKDRLKINHLVLKPYKKSRDRYHSELEITAHFMIPIHDGIKIAGINLFRYTPYDEITSLELIQSAVNRFGSEEYMSLAIKEGEGFDEKYNINISEGMGEQQNKVRLPFKMTRKDLSSLLEVLDILGIFYEANHNTIKVSPAQNSTLTLSAQAMAYHWALRKGFLPCLYSAKEEERECYLSEDKVELGDEHKKSKRFTVERKTSYYRPEVALTQDDLVELESFMHQIGITLNRMWKVDYYGVEQKPKQKPKDNLNSSTIDT